MALTWKFRGFDYSSYYKGGYTNADSLPALVATGANAIETTLDWGINTLTNTVYADSNYTDPLTAEAAVIREAVAKGLQVMVKPHIDFLNAADFKNPPYSIGDWRTYYNPGAAGSTGANAFFASYKTMILQEAQVAAANGATMLCIGTELDQICGPSYKSYWDGIITAIRQQDPSLKLTFAADWNDALSPWQSGGSGLPVGTGNLATQISFASELDYLGLDVYAPLSNAAKPTLQQLVNGWTKTPVNSGATAETYGVTGNQSLIQYFESLSAAVGKPLLFTEVGFENATDAASSPAGTSTNVEDDALQALAYQSLFQAFSQSGDTSVAGAFLYNWDPNASEVGHGSIAFSPQNLPALAAVDAAFAAPTISFPPQLVAGLNIPIAVSGVALGAGSTGSVFTVNLTVGAGVLSATGAATITGSGTTALTLSGALAAVNATLATLSYTETTAGGDAIHVTASADGGPVEIGTFTVKYDADFPVLSFADDTLVSGQTVNLTGTVNTADAGRTVDYLVNGVQAATATVAADGSFAANLTLSGAVEVVTAQLTDAAGGTGVASPLMITLLDGVTLNFSAADGNVANIFYATVTGDTVNGSNGTIVLSHSIAAIHGGGDTVYLDGSSNNVANLYNTGGHWDLVSGSNGGVGLTAAQASVVGGGDKIQLNGTSGNAVSLYTTGGDWDSVSGANASISVNKAQVSVTGGGNSLYLDSSGSDAVSLYATGGSWDLVNGSKGAVSLTNAQASVVGGSDVVYLSGSAGNVASLYNTGGNWDTVNSANGAIIVNKAQAAVIGGGDTVYLDGAASDAVSLYNTGAKWDTVQGSNGAVTLTNALVSVSGGGDHIYLSGSTSNVASLYKTSGKSDVISGANGAIYLNSAQAQASGDSDQFYFFAGAQGGNALTVSGASETFVFAAAYGQDTLGGFASGDVLQFSKSDWADYAHLLSSNDMTQGASGVTITFDASDSVVLSGVQLASLTQANFRFA